MMKRNDKVIVLYKNKKYEVRDMQNWRGSEEDLKSVFLYLLPFYGKDPLYIPVKPSTYLFGSKYEVLLEPRMFLVDIETRDILHLSLKEEHKLFPGTDQGVVDFINYLYMVYKIDAFSDITSMWDLPDDYDCGLFYDIAKLGVCIWDGKKEIFNRSQNVDPLTYEEFEIDGYIVSIDNYRLMLEELIVNLIEMINGGYCFNSMLNGRRDRELSYMNREEYRYQNLLELYDDHYAPVRQADMRGFPYLYPIGGLNAYYLTDLDELELLSSFDVPTSFLVHVFGYYDFLDEEEKSLFTSQEELCERLSNASPLQIHSFSPAQEYDFIYLGCFLPYYCEYLRGAIVYLLYDGEYESSRFPIAVSITDHNNERRFAYVDKQVQSFQQLKPILYGVLGGKEDYVEETYRV